MQLDQSRELYAKAIRVIPGGVNSPVRAFKSVGGDPIFIESAQGATVTSVDGCQYVDYVGSWGPMIVGHAHPHVINAVQLAVKKGLSFGAPTELEHQLAEMVTQRMPSIEQVRFVNSGTEAVMSALRLARGFTKKNKVIKFAGCYHGHCDSMLVEAGSGALTLGIPSSLGVANHVAADTLVASFNSLASVEKLFAEQGADIAAIIIEPIAGNMGVILPQPDFLAGLRSLCDKNQALLIFDEVMTGFRVASGGAQALFGVTPDLTTLGKIVGGGMPVGAFGGRADIMGLLAPLGPVYQAGTLSGNPIAMKAGIATLEVLSDPSVYDRLAEKTAMMQANIQRSSIKHRVPVVVNAVCGMLSLFFTEKSEVTCYKEVCGSETDTYSQLFHALLDNGHYLAPSAFETWFVSDAHSMQTIEQTCLEIDKFLGCLH